MSHPRPRVLLVLATSAGGVGRHVRSLAAQLTPHCALTVAGPPANRPLFADLDQVRYARVDIGPRPHPTRDLRAGLALRRLARTHDLVHAHGLRAAALTVLSRPGVLRTMPQRRPAPAVSTWHNAVDGPLGRALEQLVARRCEVVLAASADLAARARAAGGRDVRDGPVAAPALVPSGRDPGLGRPLVLAVGRLHPQKGYDTLVAALPQLEDAVVAVAGDGPLRAVLTSAAPQICWLGARDDVADLLAAADVVVLPSVWEARSLTAQEALRAGRPLVATAVGGVPALVGDGAVLVPPGDPQALGEAVRRLLDHPAEAAAVAARGRLVASSWPTEGDTARQVLALYRELLG